MTNHTVDGSGKVRAEHLERSAFLYVRQSSLFQVEHHGESKRRQYDIVRWAVDAGWPRERVVVVDEDQGTTAAVAEARGGFARLAAAVGRGEVGIVVSLEVSRLARNSPDWHNLMYVCRWTNTLMADEHAVYDLALGADRMVLGLRGQFSEMELDTSIHRMVEARWNKVRRGEMVTIPPAGYDLDERGQLTRASDEAVAHAVQTLFVKFEELGSARQVWVWWCEQGLQLPVRRMEPRSHPVVWTKPTYAGVLNFLKHPIYAGAFVFGRSQTVRELDAADGRTLRVHRVQRLRDQWPVLIKDHHDGYITFEAWLRNQERIRGNCMMERKGDLEIERGPAREGAALIQGLTRCGHCGRGMFVSYGGHRPGCSGRTRQYRCHGARLTNARKDCQLLGGKRIDELVTGVFLEVIEPGAVEAAAQADELLRADNEALERAWRLQVEKAEYEAQRAQRQFSAVEPENRLVARELERRWNERLRELDVLRAESGTAQRRREPLSQQELARARDLGADVEALWRADTTTHRDRKRLLRCLVEEVQLSTTESHYIVRIVWKGGAITVREVARVRAGQGQATAEETIDLVRKLAVEFDDTQVARILNRQRRRSGQGLPFTQSSVRSLRGKHQIPMCPRKQARDEREGPFTADEAARELRVSMDTVHRWLRDGVLAGAQLAPGAPWRIVLSEEVRKRLSGGDAPPGSVGLTEAARHLGLSKSHVAYLVKTGKLPAVRTKVGKRSCWRIDVSSTTYGCQPSLLEQARNDESQGA